MGLLKRLLGERDDDTALALYNAVVARARDPHWYLAGGVSDTIEGRFDMVATVLAFLLLRLESDPAAAALAARVTERFVTDMDGQLREIGIGDVVVGKHVGRMMGMLGGRIGAYRAGLATGDLEVALVRNLYRGVTPEPGALGFTVARLRAFAAALAKTDLARIAAGELP